MADPRVQQIVEAMARAQYDHNKLMTELSWDDLVEMAKASPFTRRLLDQKREAMHAALSALVAVPGVVVTEVGEEVVCTNQADDKEWAWVQGVNHCRAATLAGRVKL